MNLRDRLRLLKAAGSKSAVQAHPTEPLVGPAPLIDHEQTELITAQTEAADSARRHVTVGGALFGYEIDTTCGPAFYVEERYPIEHCRGPLPLERVFDVPGGAWEVLGRIPPGLDLRRAAFFDTETTGLAGGSGTYAFLIGVGFFEGCDFVVRQYFMRDYGEEEAILEALEHDLAACDLLVSFNGKSFDWPLMETRYRMSRRRPPMQGVPHLDLLHPARRIWKERLGACNLTNLETHILGLERFGDVPGHLIPELYFHYLRTGEARELAGVMLHNRLDIVSLVSLAAWMGGLVSDPLATSPDGELVPGDDLFSLGRLLEDRDLLGPALTCYEAAIERGVPAVGESRALQVISTAYKRIREHERAISIWQSMIRGAGALSLFPYVELAKYYEHVVKEYSLALELTERALQIAERRRSIAGLYGPATLRDVQTVQHRLERLQRKASRQAKAQ